MLESIEKLRDSCHEDGSYYCKDTMEMYCNAIEAEIAERYMELPLDADGVPIHVGDEMESDNERFVVCAVAPGRVHRWHVHNIGELDKGTVAYPPDSLRHFKPRTVEDVLSDFRAEADMIYNDPKIGGVERADELSALDAKYADEIRELMGGDAE